MEEEEARGKEEACLIKLLPLRTEEESEEASEKERAREKERGRERETEKEREKGREGWGRGGGVERREES